MNFFRQSNHINFLFFMERTKDKNKYGITRDFLQVQISDEDYDRWAGYSFPVSVNSFPEVLAEVLPKNEYKRPSKTQNFLEIASKIAERSHDSQTQHGCVITDTEGRILSTGYNGFISGSDDKSLPNTRPQKYPFIIHAEENALLSAARNGVAVINSTAYVTGHSCINCLKHMIQSGVTSFYVGPRRYNGIDQDDFMREYLIAAHNVNYQEIK